MGSKMIHGSIPVGIGNLVSLTLLGMEENTFTGSNFATLGKLKKLQKLYLNYNRLSGLIPSSRGNFTQLIAVFMEENNLDGNMHASLGNYQNLPQVNLYSNNLNYTLPKEVIGISSLSISFAVKLNSLTGSLLVEVGNLNSKTLCSCVSLERLYMAGNSFQGKSFQGSFPLSFETLRALDEVDHSRIKLSRMIPQYLGHFSFLKILNVSFNDFEGEVPILGLFANASAISVVGNMGLCVVSMETYLMTLDGFGAWENFKSMGSLPIDVGLTLPNLEVFAGGVNNFTGSIPVSLSNASGLVILDFAQNRITGLVPVSLGSLKRLIRLNFNDNHLGSGQSSDLNFLTFLINCTNLQMLGIEINRLGGKLPDSITNLSTQLSRFKMGSNMIHGSIPVWIGNLVNLTLLGMSGNIFSGSIPDTLGKIKKLQELYLNNNRFSGLIPSSIGNLTQLIKVFMEENNLEGNIPASLGNCQNLLQLNLSFNNLNGTIPKEVISISSLSISFAVKHNS
ncbi:LRR receptor-like serine/threonine-protein kinase EFR [Telopea speciosissima]|uniref:LRR receptor-like serine/threonine-protein kinase EFR n=1 Tax=Telopea speciosissima TaxID=54955 RepID=UPI001CC6C8F6|nr:LRR receptor-like serine/threonine-protein kinase EFR [Telopea speciosissima]